MPKLALNICLLSIIFFSSEMFTSNNIQAETRYVNDVLLISLRTGPGKNFKIIKTLKTGAALKVLDDKGEFVQVRTDDGGTGWVAKYYTDKDLPKHIIIEQLTAKLQEKEKDLKREQENNAPVKNLVELKKKNEQEITELKLKLTDFETKYNAILSQSSDIIKTAKERDQLQQEKSKLSEKITTLAAANSSLENYRIIYWFLAGGGLLLVGWILGCVTKSKRTRTITL